MSIVKMLNTAMLDLCCYYSRTVNWHFWQTDTCDSTMHQQVVSVRSERKRVNMPLLEDLARCRTSHVDAPARFDQKKTQTLH